MNMIGELTVGKRYKVTLRSRAFQGHLEGTLRATDLPEGARGNEDGQHSIWFSGEIFEWFLRFDDIATIEEVHDAAAEPALAPARRPHCATIHHAIRRHRIAAVRGSHRVALESSPEPFFRCLSGRGRSA
jgi:hypothetical protein